MATCGDLQQVGVSQLQQEFGAKLGQTLHDLSHGEDKRPIQVNILLPNILTENQNEN